MYLIINQKEKCFTQICFMLFKLVFSLFGNINKVEYFHYLNKCSVLLNHTSVDCVEYFCVVVLIVAVIICLPNLMALMKSVSIVKILHVFIFFGGSNINFCKENKLYQTLKYVTCMYYAIQSL